MVRYARGSGREEDFMNIEIKNLYPELLYYSRIKSIAKLIQSETSSAFHASDVDSEPSPESAPIFGEGAVAGVAPRGSEGYSKRSRLRVKPAMTTR